MKDSQLQIRVTEAQKNAIKRAATRSGRDVSAWVLGRCFSEKRQTFEILIRQIKKGSNPSFELAKLNDFLEKLDGRDFLDVLNFPIASDFDPKLANRIAAMIEYAAYKKKALVPEWVHLVPILSNPIFDSDLLSLRLHLLLNSPPPFKKRNIFLDASIGDRV